MKTMLPIRFVVCSALALLTQTTFAQTWQTVDDFQYLGYTSANQGLAVAPDGVIFAAGYGVRGGYHALVMASSDNGATWSAPLDDVGGNGSSARYDAGIVSDSAGNLYAAGVNYAYTSTNAWLVRRSTDGGATWSTVDDYGPSVNGDGATGLTADADGNVYVVGRGSAGQGWLVRKGIGGTSFATVDNFSSVSKLGGTSASVRGVFAHPTAGVFAVGAVPNRNTGALVWVVRRSTDGGATWQTVDSFQLSKQYNSYAQRMEADANGNLYVVGNAGTGSKGGSYWHWVVRKSADGGNSWSTVDNYQLSANGDSEVSGFVADSVGNLYVAGYATPSGNFYFGTAQPAHWIVRMNPGGTGVWQTVDDFEYAAGTSSYAQAITANAGGNVFVGGFGYDALGKQHWLVERK